MTSKKKKPLTCPVCKKKFYHSSKSHPMKRLSKHLWKEHRSYMEKKIRAGVRKSKQTKVRDLDKEFMAMDDIILAVLMEEMKHRDSIQHEALGGKILSRVTSPWAMLGEYMLETMMKGPVTGQRPKNPILKALFGGTYDLFGGDYVPKKTKRK